MLHYKRLLPPKIIPYSPNLSKQKTKRIRSFASFQTAALAAFIPVSQSEKNITLDNEQIKNRLHIQKRFDRFIKKVNATENHHRLIIKISRNDEAFVAKWLILIPLVILQTSVIWFHDLHIHLDLFRVTKCSRPVTSCFQQVNYTVENSTLTNAVLQAVKLVF